MRKFLRFLSSVALRARLSSSWGEEVEHATEDRCLLVEAAAINLMYDRNIDYSIEDSHFPDTRGPFIFAHTAALTITLFNFDLNLSVEWETEP